MPRTVLAPSTVRSLRTSASTVWPASLRAAMVAVPMYPVPPVMNTFMAFTVAETAREVQDRCGRR